MKNNLNLFMVIKMAEPKKKRIANKEIAKKDETFDDKAKQSHKENLDLTKKNDPTKIHQTDGKEKDKKLEELNRVELARTLRSKGAFIGPGSCGCSNCNMHGKQICDCGKSSGGGSSDDASQKSDTAIKKMQSFHKKSLVAEDSLASKWQTPQFHPTKTHSAEEQHQLLKDLLATLENVFMSFIKSLKLQGLLNHHDAYNLAQQFKFTVTLDKDGQLTIGLYTPPGLLSNNQLALLEDILRDTIAKDEKFDLIDADQIAFHRLPTPLSMECRYVQKLFKALMDEYTHNGGSDAHDFICTAYDDSDNAQQINITLALPAYFSPAHQETIVVYIQQEMQRELGAGIVNQLNFIAPQRPQMDEIQEQSAQSLRSFNPTPFKMALTLSRD